MWIIEISDYYYDDRRAQDIVGPFEPEQDAQEFVANDWDMISEDGKTKKRLYWNILELTSPMHFRKSFIKQYGKKSDTVIFHLTNKISVLF